MFRTTCAAAVAALMAVPAWADVTVTAELTGKGIGKAAEAQSITYIKGLRQRTDAVLRGTPTSTIIDLDAQKFISLNHKKKEAVVYDMAKFRQDLDKMVKGAEATYSLKPSGETREIAGRSCDGYLMNVTMPMALAEGMEMTLTMSGPVFIAKGAPGSDDYNAFYLAAAEKGFIANDPRAAKGAAAQTKGMTALYKAIAETGGLPYAMEWTIKIEGGGPMAGMMNKMMGGSGFTQTITAVATDEIPADKFDIPAGFKVKTEK
jgi:hypothetical protein